MLRHRCALAAVAITFLTAQPFAQTGATVVRWWVEPAGCRADSKSARHSRSRHHARHARRHQSRKLYAPEELHAAARYAGQPSQDGRRRPRRRVLHRLRGPGPADAGRLRQRLQAGGRQVRRRASPDQGDCARADRARAHRGGCAADCEVGKEGRADRHRERLFARHRHQARQGVSRSRRPLHVAGAQRPQPVRRLEHRRARRQVAAQRPQRHRQAGDCRDEQVGDHGRPVASVEGRQPAGAGAVEGAGDRVALRGPRACRSQPQHGRRAAGSAEEERRRDSDGGVCGYVKVAEA